MAKILIVDDEENIRKLFSIFLTGEGHEVQTAPNGNAAIDILNASDVNLLITDIIMPEREGLETILEVRKSFPHIKIIAISGGGKGSPDDYLMSARAMGASFTLAKPIHRKNLIEAVDTVLKA